MDPITLNTTMAAGASAPATAVGADAPWRLDPDEVRLFASMMQADPRHVAAPEQGGMKELVMHIASKVNGNGQSLGEIGDSAIKALASLDPRDPIAAYYEIMNLSTQTTTAATRLNLSMGLVSALNNFLGGLLRNNQ